MTESMTTKLHSLLFEEGRKLENIKFFPGTRAGLTPTELSDAADGAIRMAFSGGLVNNPPVTGRAKCKLAAFN